MFHVEIYDRNWVLLSKIYELGAFNFSKKINREGFFQFKISISKADGDIIKKTNFLKLYKTRNNKQYLVFEGFIDGLVPEIDFVTVLATDLIGFFKYKFSPITFPETARNANDYLASMITSLNNDEDTGITIGENNLALDTNLKTTSKESILNFLTKLSNNVEAEFEVVNRKLNFKSNIGQDRSGEIQLIYDIDNPSSTNISEPILESALNNYANYLVVEGNGTSVISFDTNEIAKSGKIKKFISQKDISDNTALQTYADALLKKTIEDLSLKELQAEKLEIEKVGIGDIVNLNINTNNTINSFTGITRVMGLDLRVQDTYENVNLTLSENIKSVQQGFLGRLQDLSEKVGEIYRQF